MHIVIVGGGTAGWSTALIAARRHLGVHNITVIESSKIGVVGVGESTTGLLTDFLTNHFWDLGCDHDEFIAETGATLKYAIKHKGWTSDIDDYYLGPIDGSFSKESVPDLLFSYVFNRFPNKDLPKASEIGTWILNGASNFNKESNTFSTYTHAMHVDAHLVGKYFKKVCLRNPNANHIDSEVTNVNLKENGHIKSVTLNNGQIIDGDFFIDCSGFNKVLMKHMPSKWVSYQKYLPVNTGMPFQLKYQDNEMPEPYTTAWAQKNGWMWQIPLMDRKGCGYVFCDAFTTPDKAQEEIETILGREIDPIRVIKFDTGRQESAWINNCLTIGLSSAFLEPLEATSIHSTVVQARSFIFEYLKPTLEQTLNEGSRKIYNQRTRVLFDDVKDFINLHYMGGRTDSEFWRWINTGATMADFTANLLEMCKSRMPTGSDYPKYFGSAGQGLYSYVLAGINKLDKNIALEEINFDVAPYGSVLQVTAEQYYHLQDQWKQDMSKQYTYNELIAYFRNIRKDRGFSN
jgi:tryptophan halogenase